MRPLKKAAYYRLADRSLKPNPGNGPRIPRTSAIALKRSPISPGSSSVVRRLREPQPRGSLRGLRRSARQLAVDADARQINGPASRTPRFESARPAPHPRARKSRPRRVRSCEARIGEADPRRADDAESAQRAAVARRMVVLRPRQSVVDDRGSRLRERCADARRASRAGRARSSEAKSVRHRRRQARAAARRRPPERVHPAARADQAKRVAARDDADRFAAVARVTRKRSTGNASTTSFANATPRHGSAGGASSHSNRSRNAASARQRPMRSRWRAASAGLGSTMR